MTTKNRPQRSSDSRDNLESLLDLLPDVIYKLDLHNNFTHLNIVGCRVLELDPDEAIGQSLLQWTHPEDRSALLTEFDEQIKKGNEVFSVKSRLVSKSAVTRHLIHYVRVLRNENGEIVGKQGIARDAGELQGSDGTSTRTDGEYKAFGSKEETDPTSVRFTMDDGGKGNENAGAMLKRETRFETLIEHLPDVIWETDDSGRTVFLSASVEKIVGYTPEEVYAVGYKWLERVHPDHLAEIKNAYRRLFQGEEFDFEFQIQRRDGEWRWLNFKALPSFLTEGSRHAGGILSDITDRKDVESQLRKARQELEERVAERTEELSLSNRNLWLEIAERTRIEGQLRESEQRFRSAFTNAAVGMALTGPDGRFLEVNRVLCDITGYSETELLDRTFQSITYSEDLELGARGLANLLAGASGEYWIEKRYVHKQGQLVWIQLSTSLVKDPAGQPLYFVSLIQDITKRKQSEEALKESENKFRTLFNNAQDAVVVHELAGQGGPGRLVEANPVACERLGYSREELLKMTPLDYVPEDCHGEIPGISQILLAKGHITFEIVNITKSGVRIPVEINSHVFHLAGRDVVLSISRDITERKQIEDRLRESEERYRRLVEVSPDPIAVHFEGKVVFVNSAALDLLGAESVDQVIGRPMMDFVHPGYRHVVGQRVSKMMGGQSKVSMIEEKFLRLDGTPIDVDVAATPLKYMGKSAMLVIAHDVSGRKRAEAELRQALDESQLRSAETEALLQSARAVLEEQDFDSSARLVYKTFKKLVGATSGFIALLSGDETEIRLLAIDSGELHEAEGRDSSLSLRWLFDLDVVQGKAFQINDLTNSNWSAFLPEDHVHVDNMLVAPITSKGRVVGLVVLANKPGEFSEDDVRMAAAFGELASIAYQNNLTMQSLEKSEEHFRSVVQTAHDAVISTDATGLIVFWNNAATRLFGYSPEEMVGQRLDLIIPDRFTTDHKSAWERLTRTGILRLSEKTVELTGVKKDGTEFPLELSVQGWKTREGAFFTGIVRDTTERVRMEEQLRRAQRLETAGRIAGQVAHDFNNLLSPLVGYPELIKMELPDGHPASEICDAMVKAAEQMADINEDLMALGRRGHFNQEPVDINHLIEQAISQMLNKPDSLTIETNLAEDLLPANGASAQLLRVISNLLSNSREAMQDDGVLRVRTENVYIDEPFGRYNRIEVGEYVRLDVTDTGCGIPVEIKDKIFDAFFTTRRSGKSRGSGLGLSVVQAIMDDHHGYVDFESVPGKGTTFSLYLPVSRDAQKENRGRDIQRGHEFILVVDDDDVQRDLLKRLLESQGYEIAVVGRGEDAVAYCEKHRPDLVVLDMIMPGIDGTETYRRILEKNPNQRAIILSGFAESDRVVEAQALGAGAYVRKPVTLTKLARAVRDELDRRPALGSPIQPQ